MTHFVWAETPEGHWLVLADVNKDIGWLPWNKRIPGWKWKRFANELDARREIRRLQPEFADYRMRALPGGARLGELGRRFGNALGRRRNPSRRDDAFLDRYRDEVSDARNLFEAFTGHAADRGRRIDVKHPKVIMVVGKVDGLLYETVRDGRTEKYIHRFRKHARPTLGISHDGQQLVILGGGYQFTDAGIEDRPRNRRR